MNFRFITKAKLDYTIIPKITWTKPQNRSRISLTSNSNNSNLHYEKTILYGS